MFSSWPIRKKLLLGMTVLLVMVVVLSFSGFSGVYSYRALARDISSRARELPLATRLAHAVSELRLAVNEVTSSSNDLLPCCPENCDERLDLLILRDGFNSELKEVRATLEEYREQLRENEQGRLTSSRIGVTKAE